MTIKLTRETYQNKSDEELVQLSIVDVDAFYFLIKRYEPKIVRYISRMSGSKQDIAEDILQEIFIKVYRNLNSFNPKLKFSSWVYRIAHNEIINQYYKDKARTATVSLDDTDQIDLSAKLIYDEDIHNTYVFGETAKAVKKALEELPLKYREVLILRFFEDKDYKEISDILRKPPGTVAALLNRAKIKFKKIARQYELDNGI
ncbi:MAG: RNA polymerase sigma factor [Deltaproteobacteria bacterium]|nr:RNA polymerase sigma factor [Deltaproteobacteria bacterium]